MANIALSIALSKRVEPAFAPLEVPALKPLIQNGLDRGILAEIIGPRSAGCTSVFLHVLAQATRRGEICAVVDVADTFHPAAAADSGIQLQRLLWVRCHGNPEHAMRAADLLLHAGGFGVVLLNLCEASAHMLNRVPLSYWYRFRRAIENTPTILVVCATASEVKCSAVTKLHLKPKAFHWGGRAPFSVLRGIEVQAAETHSSLVSLEPLRLQTVA